MAIICINIDNRFICDEQLIIYPQRRKQRIIESDIELILKK